MNIYFSGIGGVGIGPLAEIAHDAGYRIFGSDTSESLVTQELQQKGIQISFVQDGPFLQQVHDNTPLDWFIYTAALPADHPELLLAQNLGIKTGKRDELLAHIISEKNLKLLAVAGTHGKTTTTGMFVWTLQQLGIPVSYSIGTTLSWGPSGKYDPASEYFVYECDEFDRNFLHFHPYLSIITNTDYDHVDTYPTVDDYHAAFAQFESQSEIIIKDLPEMPGLTLPGAHNRHNGSLVLNAIEKLGVAGNSLAAINSFPGTNRRFEKLAGNLYTDYGHHPAEIAATLQMARELSEHVILIYQPHQNVRQHEIRKQYTADIFQNAEEVYWLPTYLSREDNNLPILTPEELSKNITGVQTADLNDDLWKTIQTNRDAGKLVLCMGAGSIDSWLRSRL